MSFNLKTRKNLVHSGQYIYNADKDNNVIIGFSDHQYINEDVDYDLFFYTDSINKQTNAFFDIYDSYEIKNKMSHLAYIIEDMSNNNIGDNYESESSWDLQSNKDKSILSCFEMLYYFLEDISPAIVNLAINSFRLMSSDIKPVKPYVLKFNIKEFSLHVMNLADKWMDLLNSLYSYNLDITKSYNDILVEMDYFYNISKSIYATCIHPTKQFHLEKCLAVLEKSTCCKYSKIYIGIVKYFDCFFTFNVIKNW